MKQLKMRLTLRMKKQIRNYYSQMCSDEEKNLRPICPGCSQRMKIHRTPSGGSDWDTKKNKLVYHYTYAFSCENSKCLMSKEGVLSKVGAYFVKAAIKVLLIQAGHDPARMNRSADENPIAYVDCKNCNGRLYYDDWNKKPQEFIRGLEYCCPRAQSTRRGR